MASFLYLKYQTTCDTETNSLSVGDQLVKFHSYV